MIISPDKKLWLRDTESKGYLSPLISFLYRYQPSNGFKASSPQKLKTGACIKWNAYSKDGKIWVNGEIFAKEDVIVCPVAESQVLLKLIRESGL